MLKVANCQVCGQLTDVTKVAAITDCETLEIEYLGTCSRCEATVRHVVKLRE
jgi:hypothetical protein